MKLQTKLSYFKGLFGKLNKGKSDLNDMLSMQKHTTNKTDLGYNKKNTFSKKTQFVSSKGVNSNKVSKKRNMVYSNRNAKTCHY